MTTDTSTADVAPKPDRGSVATTATVALSTAGTAAVLTWGFGCIQAGHFSMPDQSTILVMAGAMAPFTHAARNTALSWFSRKTGVVLPPAAPQQAAAVQ